MRCSEARNLITRHLYEAPETAETARLATHLAGCRACAGEQQAALQLERRLRTMQGSETPRALPSVTVDRERVFAASRPRVSRAAVPAALALGGGAAVLALSVLPRPATITRGVGEVEPQNVPPPAQAKLDAPFATGPARKPHGAPRQASRPTTARPAGTPLPRLTRTPPADEAYLDGRDPALGAAWLSGDSGDLRARAWLERRLPPMRDDFVRIPLPRLAAADQRTTAAAVKEYEREAKTVDARLIQKVTLQSKAVSLEELCKDLSRQTRVKLSASRGVLNEKATVLVKDLPARDVMRAVARLFGYNWARTGSEGAYQYVLTQDLRSQLAEQEMRNRDLNEALLALDEKMAAYDPVAGLLPAQIKEQLAAAKGHERQLLTRSSGVMWGGIQLYQRLTPAERAALGQGRALQFSSDATLPGQRIPQEWTRPLLGTWDMAITTDGPGGRSVFSPRRFIQDQTLPHTPIEDAAGATAIVQLKVGHSELGRVSLQANTSFFVDLNGGKPGLGSENVLAEAQSPSVARPNNRAANQALKAQPPFDRVVTLRPEPSCPTLREEQMRRQAGQGPVTEEEIQRASLEFGRNLDTAGVERLLRLRHPHVTSADVWEAIHIASGLPVVADSYSRLYDPKSIAREKRTLFEALCHASDEMGVRWKQDGQFLLARSTSFFWDKLKEVPNSDLERWRRNKLEQGGLPFDDMVEMAQLSDDQLDSQRVGEVVGHCWALPEWDLLQRPIGYYSPRPWLRWLSNLPPGSRSAAVSPAGLSLRGLTGAVQGEVVALLGIQGGAPRDLVESLPDRRVRIGYASEGSYEWSPRLGPGRDQNQAAVSPVISAPTAEATLAAAKLIDPTVTPGDIVRSDGTLIVTILAPKGVSWNAAGQRRLRSPGRP